MKKCYLLFISLLLVGCNSSSNKYKGTWENIIASNIIATHGGSVNPFNTVMSLKYFVSDDIEDKESMLNDIKSIYQTNISDLHKKFDRHASYYIDDSNTGLGTYKNIKSLNFSKNNEEYLVLNKETYDLVKFGYEMTIYTEGYFNIFTGSLTDYWDEVFSEVYNDGLLSDFDPYFSSSQKEKLEYLVSCIPTINELPNVISFDDSNNSIKFNSLSNDKNDISISVGGIAKGYATEIVKNKLLEKGYESGYLFSGSSSISSLKNPIYNNSEGQYLSVLDPRSAANIVDKKEAFGMYLVDEFNMSTSGNYTSGKSYDLMDNDGKYITTRHHIIDSYTGYPSNNFASVTIFSKKLGASYMDAFSTALVNMDIEKGLEFRKKVMKDFDADFEIVYIKEDVSKKTIEVISTSNFNNTLELVNKERSSLRYV